MKVTVKQLEEALDQADRLGVLEGALRERLRDLVQARRLGEALDLVNKVVQNAGSGSRGEDPNAMTPEEFDAWVRTRPWVAMRSKRLQGRVVLVLLNEERYEEARSIWPDAAILTLAEGLGLADHQPSDQALALIMDVLANFGARLQGGPDPSVN